MADIVYLIRHGQSLFNAEWERTQRDPMIIDAPLSDVGRDQARALSATVGALGVDVAITSPLTRAIQTTLGVFGAHGLPIEVDCLHREYLWSSCDIGRSPGLLAEQFDTLSFDHLSDPWWHCPSGDRTKLHKESLDIVMPRVETFLEQVRVRPEKKVAVIGHCTFFWYLTGHLMQNCEVYELEPQWHRIPPPAPVPGSDEDDGI